MFDLPLFQFSQTKTEQAEVSQTNRPAEPQTLEELVVLLIPDVPEDVTLLSRSFKRKKQKALIDEAYRKEFLKRLTIEEILYILFEKSLQAPLSEDGARIYYHYFKLFCKENHIDCPEEISFPPPDEYTLREVELEAERLRKKQIEAVKKALKKRVK